MVEDKSMQTINRSIQVLKSFSSEVKELSLAQLHHNLGISKSSLQRILNTLVIHGFLEKDNKRKTYKLGMELFYLGNLVEEHSHLITAAKPYLKAARDKLGENVYLNIIDKDVRKCIAIETSDQILMTISHIGHTSPLHSGASAKVLLAFQEESWIKDYLSKNKLESITDKTITDSAKLMKELESIRQKGFAISLSERVSGACSVSAPVFNRQNEIVASISVSAPLVRVNKSITKKFITTMTEVASQVSRDLSFTELNYK